MTNLKEFFTSKQILKGIEIYHNPTTNAFTVHMMRRVRLDDAKDIAIRFTELVPQADVQLRTHTLRGTRHYLEVTWVCASFMDMMNSIEFMNDQLKVCYRQNKIAAMKAEIDDLTRYTRPTRLVPVGAENNRQWMFEEEYKEDLPF